MVSSRVIDAALRAVHVKTPTAEAQRGERSLLIRLTQQSEPFTWDLDSIIQQVERDPELLQLIERAYEMTLRHILGQRRTSERRGKPSSVFPPPPPPVVVETDPPIAGNAKEQLIAELRRNPSRELKLILSDLLSEQGDAHGELIALECAGGDRAERQALRLKVAGALEEKIDRWHEGFADVTLVLNPTETIALCKHPVGALLRDVNMRLNRMPLSLEIPEAQTGATDPLMTTALEQLPPTCEVLTIETQRLMPDTEPMQPIDLSALLRRLPRLSTLHLSGLPVRWSPVRHAQLKSLFLTAFEPWRLFELELPALEELSVLTGSAALPNDAAEWRRRYPQLRKLFVTPANLKRYGLVEAFAKVGIELVSSQYRPAWEVQVVRA